MKAVFLDRDGTVNLGTPPYERIDSLEKVELLPLTLKALGLLSGLDYGVFLISNQPCIAEGYIDSVEAETINDKVLKLIEPSGVHIIKCYTCPHGKDNTCECRKPKPRMLLDAAHEYDIDLSSSYMIGDRPTDVMTGVNAGTKTILVQTGDPTAKSAEATFIAPTLLEAVRYIIDHTAGT